MNWTGADSPYSGVVAAFSFALLRGTTPVVHGTGEQSRDFTFVEDVVRGCILAMQTETEGCQTVNLACGGSHSVLEYVIRFKDGSEWSSQSYIKDVNPETLARHQQFIAFIAERAGIEL